MAKIQTSKTHDGLPDAIPLLDILAKMGPHVGLVMARTFRYASVELAYRELRRIATRKNMIDSLFIWNMMAQRKI